MHDNLSFYFKTGSSKFVDFFLPILPSYSYDAINKVVLDFGDLVCTEIRETPKLEKKKPSVSWMFCKNQYDIFNWSLSSQWILCILRYTQEHSVLSDLIRNLSNLSAWNYRILVHPTSWLWSKFISIHLLTSYVYNETSGIPLCIVLSFSYLILTPGTLRFVLCIDTFLIKKTLENMILALCFL